MAMTGTYTLTDFIADLDRITRDESAAHRITARAAPLLARLVRDPSSIPARYLTSPPGQRGRDAMEAYLRWEEALDSEGSSPHRLLKDP